MRKHYENEADIKAVVEGFEGCSTPKEAFTHREHLTVATWYLRHSSPEEALDKMRAGLQRFLEHHGIGSTKYKEQITVTWMDLIQRTLEKEDKSLSLVAAINIVLDCLGDSQLVSEGKP